MRPPWRGEVRAAEESPALYQVEVRIRWTRGNRGAALRALSRASIDALVRAREEGE